MNACAPASRLLARSAYGEELNTTTDASGAQWCNGRTRDRPSAGPRPASSTITSGGCAAAMSRAAGAVVASYIGPNRSSCSSSRCSSCTSDGWSSTTRTDKLMAAGCPIRTQSRHPNGGTWLRTVGRVPAAAPEELFAALDVAGAPRMLIALGGTLDPPTLAAAYRAGCFPWPSGDDSDEQLDRTARRLVRRGEVPQ